MPAGRRMFVHVSNSFRESDRVMADYYAALTCEEKLDIGQYLREQYYKIKGIAAERMDKTSVHVLFLKTPPCGKRTGKAGKIYES